ncbi:MAG: hypothetical protein ABSF89_16010 [Acidimicrobiales bacterium]
MGSLLWSITGVHGEAILDPVVVVDGQLDYQGFPRGAVLLLLATASAQVEGSGTMAQLGPAELLTVQLAANSSGGMATRDIHLRFQFSMTAALEFERRRAGSGFQLFANSQVIALWFGQPMTDNEAFPILSLATTQRSVTAAEWNTVVSQWGRGVAIPLLVPLPQALPTPEHQAIVSCLQEALSKVQAGNFRDAVLDARRATELMRKLLPAVPGSSKRERTVPERQSALLDALFDLESAAAHPDEPVRSAVWHREDALLVLATAAGLAQLVMME